MTIRRYIEVFESNHSVSEIFLDHDSQLLNSKYLTLIQVELRLKVEKDLLLT